MEILQIFNSIRDIPYQIPLSLDDEAIDCDQKHKKLSEELAKMGLQVRFRICSFLWSEQNIPNNILQIPHVDTCEHLYLEAYINNRWIILDITWDIGLNSLFTINDWDGISNTEIAVKPLEIYPLRENCELSHNKTESSFVEDIRTSGAFYKAINEWLAENRKIIAVRKTTPKKDLDQRM